MSLWSIFYAGDLARIEPSIRRCQTEIDGVRSFDFSGGLSHPFLMPEDFATLLGDVPGTFWDLRNGNILEESEAGLYPVPDAECDRLIALAETRVHEFSQDWNRKRRQRQQKPPVSRGRSAFWTISFASLAGLLPGMLRDRILSHGELQTLAIWLACFLLIGFLRARSRSRRKARNEERIEIDVDWAPEIKRLQNFLKTSRHQGQPIYYFWSL
jgi:hypothetical protein